MRRPNGRAALPAADPDTGRRTPKRRPPPGSGNGARRRPAERDLLAAASKDAPFVVWSADGEGRVITFNAHWSTITGRDPAHEAGDRWQSSIHPDDRDAVRATMRSAVSARQSFKIEFRVRHEGGEYRDVVFSGAPRQRGSGTYIGTALDVTLRRRSQDAVRDSAYRYRELADSIGALFCALDRDMHFTYWNAACEAFTGKAATEVIGRSAFQLFPSLRRHPVAELLTSGRSGTQTLELEFTRAGRQVAMEVRAYPSRSGISVIATDVTRRHTAEMALKASEVKYRTIFDNANEAIIIFEPRTEKILEANSRALEQYGFSREEFVGMSLKKITMNVLRGEQQIEQMLRNGSYRDFETVHFRKDGTPLQLAVNASVIDYNGAPAILSINRDVSYFRPTGEDLEQQHKVLQHLLESTDDIVSMQDREGRYLFFNGSPRYGLTLEDVRGKTPYDFHHPSVARKMMERIYQVVATGRSVSAESRLEWRGEVLWFLDQISPVRNDGGGVLSVVTISRNITERKKAEERLRRSEERYRAFIEQSSDGIWRFETIQPIPVSLPPEEQVEQFFQYGYLAECNEAMLAMLGQASAEAVVGLPAGSLISRNNAQNLEALTTFIRSAYRLIDAEVREVAPDGTVRYTLNTYVGIVEEAHLVRVWGSRRDVTARTQVERELHLLAQTITSTKDLVSITDLDHRVLFVNDAFLSAYGYTLEELLGKPLSMVRSPGMSEDQAAQILPATLEGGWYGEVLHRRKDGSDFSLEVWTSVVRNNEGEPVAMVGVARDITERKRMEQALRQSEARLRRITDTMQDIITVTDLAGVVQYASPSYSTVLGSPVHEAVGQSVFAKIHPDDVALASQTFASAVLARTGGRMEFRYRHASGDYLWLETVGNLLFDEQGNVTGVVFATRDITERKRVQDQITASLREKEVLLKEIHHRVKNNLQVISSLLSLQADAIQDQETRRALKESQNRVRSMAIIHQRLYQSGNLAEVNFGGYIKELCSQLFRSYGAASQKIALSMDTEEISLGVDKAIPCGIILNELVTNALKYAFADGKGGTVTVGLHAANTQVQLVVRDDGLGMPAGVEHARSDSLGMKLVHMLVEQISGTLACDPEEPGRAERPGTRWTIQFGM
jgi:PAS domain S-box-containing protein